MKTHRNISQDRIERLEEIGFQWQGVDYDGAFKKRCRELTSFKEQFGDTTMFRIGMQVTHHWDNHGVAM